MLRGSRISKLLASTTPETGAVVCGWVRTLRESANLAFAALNDGSCQDSLQVVLPLSLPNYQEILRAGNGAALRVEGDLVESPGKGQRWELRASAVNVLGPAGEDYPLQKKRHSFEFLRTLAHLRPRTSTFGAVFRIENTAAWAIHRFFQERGFIYVHTPIITCSDAEGAGEMFRVTTLDPEAPPRSSAGGVDWARDFFGRPASLTVSGQLEAEIFALAFSDVYTFGPTFRAENSNTPRHVAEFWMIEPEIAFADLDDDVRLAEDFLRAITRDVLERNRDDLEFLDRFVENGLVTRLEAVRDASFARVTYTEAVKLLETAKHDFEFPPSWGMDLQTEHERFLSEEVFRGPVFVTDYPAASKAFYMRRNDDGRTVAAMDLLVPRVGEIIGGSQREERREVLEERLRAFGLDPATYGWYLDLRRWGSAPHAGFGLGFARAVMYLTGMANIRDVIPFPRTPGNADF
ncbi:MAG: asparagine--tRNA ligase [Deltaproteobacteria bacterium]|nr:asparagine--tRNA ligase [Deltaproteobacteria bacterium]